MPGEQLHPGDEHVFSESEQDHKHLPAPTPQGWAQLCWSSSHPTWFHLLQFLKLD